MKKLMTTVSAVAVALGLYAADTGTSFETLSAGAYDINTSVGELTAQEAGTSYWVTNGTETLTVVDGTSKNSPRPVPYEESTQNQYLSIKTTLGNPVTRNVSVGGAGTAIGDGFYFDSLVKFTAFEGDQTVSLNGGKLAIWLKETLDASDNPTATNLVITAGYLDGDSVVATNYECAVAGSIDLNDGGWHRVTVKAIQSIYKNATVPGFAVYVDGLYVSSTAAKGIVAANLTDNAKLLNDSDGALFPSADQSSANMATIAAVQFDGQGDVDDLLFTATAPSFAADKEFFSIKLGQNVASFGYTAYDSNGDVIKSAVGATGDVLIPYEAGMYVAISPSAASGYVISGISGTGVTQNQDDYYVPSAAGQFVEISAVVAGAIVDGAGYATLADAAAAFNEITTAGAYVIELGANSTAGGVVFDNANTGVGAILDLKGFNITADSVNDSAAVLLVNGSLEITNSTATVGHIIGGDVPSVAATGGILWIADGICDGAVSADGATSFLITGGAFVKASNDGTLTGATLPEGYALVDGTGDFASYYVLGEAVLPVVVAEHPWYENPGAVVLAQNLPHQGPSDWVSAFHGQGSGNFLGLTYATNPTQFDLFGVDGTNELTTIHSVAAGDVDNPGFRGVAISETLGVAMTLAYANTTTMYTFPLAPMVGGAGQKAVTKPSTHGFDSAAFSPDGKYLFSNAIKGEGDDSPAVLKWSVSVAADGTVGLTKIGRKDASGRHRNLAYARINGRDLVFALAESGKVDVIDMTGDDTTAWTSATLLSNLPKISYGSLCVSGVNVEDGNGNPATPHLTVATSANGSANGSGNNVTDVLNVYALTVPASGAVSASLVKSFDQTALKVAGFGDISDASRYGNTVYVTDDEATIYFGRPDCKLYAGQFAVARNSTTIFTESLQEAVDATPAGDTVTVLKDCTITTPLSISKNLTIHNDYTITGAVNYAICIGATVSFEGTGKIERASNISGSAFCVGANETTRGAITVGTAGALTFDGLTVCGGKGGNLIKLENGTVTMNGGVLRDGLRGIKADADAGSYTSAIIINGGTITNMTGDGACAVMASAESATGTATVTINGGVISGALTYGKTVGTYSITIPGTSTAKFNADQTAFCAPGYATTLSDGWYVVGPASYTITYLNPDGTQFTDFLTGYQVPASYTANDAVTLPTAANIDLQVTGVEFGGWTNETGTVVAGWAAGDMTGDQTFYAKLDPVVLTYPTYVPANDDTIKTKFNAWAAANQDRDINSECEKQFLLNVAPDTVIPADALKITELKKVSSGWDITIECTIDGAPLTGELDSVEVANGYLAIGYTSDLTGSWTYENIPVTGVANDGKITVNVNKANANFMKAKLSSALENTNY